MRLYSAKVRIGGNVNHEVQKDGLTAPEVMVLQHVHGNDAVLDLRWTGTAEAVDVTAERARLDRLYTSFADEDGRPIVPQLFGAKYAPLPTSVPNGPEEMTQVGPQRVAADSLMA